MSASAIWHVHCSRCAFWSDMLEMHSKRGCEADARRHGWKVTKDENLCPDCVAEETP
jgi:hypothetical protein